MKILLCNEAYIGDLILSTAVLKPIKERFPYAKIGFLAGSWAKAVFEDHRLVDFLHVYDQECFNRKLIPKREKKLIEIVTKRRVTKELEAIQYDLAIDLHSYYKENSAHILYKAGIPKRIGYWTSKKPFFYNVVLSHWDCRFYHMLENHQMMMASLDFETKNFEPCLEYNQDEKPILLPSKYIAIHMGTGERYREWEKEHWQKLNTYLDRLNLPMVFVGRGKQECSLISEITKSLKNSINLSDKLSWKNLISVIKNAKFLVGLESMAGHLAASFGTPALLIYAEPLPINWRPYHPYCHIIRPKECDREKIFPLRPISTIQPEEVFEKALKICKAFKVF